MPYADVNGCALYYETMGSGPPVVFIHGHTLDRRLWDDQVGVVSRDFTAVRFDLRGHGKSQAPDGDYTPATFADDIRGLVLHLGTPSVSLVAHSVGTGAAIEYALRHPQDVTSLTLISSGLSGGGPIPSGLQRYIREQRERFEAAGASDEWVDGRVAGMVYQRTPDFERKNQRVRDMVSGWSGASWRIFQGPEQARGRTHRDRIADGEIAAPTLVVVGEHDGGAFQRGANLLTELLPNVSKAVIPDAGHLPPLDNPNAFNEVLMAFLAKTGTAPG
ncbi:MAG: alpha/beta hydrolase [Chloroflexi bacterium]|nr:alpha/beta hydrolase [Chloroflexota bacterium]MCI0769666.1 alpha/beta hydrolase [Chloroflexota bacterium]